MADAEKIVAQRRNYSRMSTYVRVISVAPEGAAAGAVRAADAIISVNGQSVATHETATTLLKAAAGDVALVIVRAGAEASATFKKADAAARTGLTLESAPKELSLKRVLADSKALADFMAYAQADLSSENLEFWVEVNAFRAAWDGAVDAAREAASTKMVDTFLRDGAEKQVCIGAWDTAVQQKAALAKDMFDASQLIAEKTLREDIFPRFEENEKGKALARDRPELCSAGGI